MAEEELIVRGLTGVDISLRIAGPGTRSFAFVTDWMIRLLIALALILAAALLQLLPSVSRPVMRVVWITTIVIASLIYLLYHPVLEVLMRGRTPGKRKAGARIVTVEGATPTVGALLLRNLFRLIDGMPGFYIVGLGCCLFTEKRVRLGDMAAGTVLVLEEAQASQALARLGEAMQRSSLPLEALRLIHDLLDRWRDLDPEERMKLARGLLTKLDPGFDSRGESARNDDALRVCLEALLGTGSGH